MKKIKGYAILCCTLSLLFVLALGATGFFLVGSVSAQQPHDTLAFWFRFFCITSPCLLSTTLVTIARIKVKE